MIKPPDDWFGGFFLIMSEELITYRLSYRELTIDPHDVAPLLGYESILPADILSMVEEVMDETAGCFDICGGYRIFDRISFVEKGKLIRIADIEFLPQNIVYQQLKNSEQISVFVCSVGEGITHWSKQMLNANEPLKGFIADILGSVVVEASIDLIHKNLSDEMRQAGLKITNRYSPGYCGWQTQEQHKLFGLLPERICGISLTKSALMQPVKSVSGMIGIGKNVCFNPYTCRICDAASCVYRNKKLRNEN